MATSDYISDDDISQEEKVSTSLFSRNRIQPNSLYNENPNIFQRCVSRINNYYISGMSKPFKVADNNRGVVFKRGINFAEYFFWTLLIVVIALGFIASLYTSYGINSGWYATVPKPSWVPPQWVFVLVWTILYLLIGVTAYTGIRSDPWILPFGLLFIVGIALNVLWTVVYFGLQSITGGFAILIILDIVVLLQILYLFFLRNNPSVITSAFLLIYLAWLCYATAVNGYQLTHQNLQ